MSGVCHKKLHREIFRNEVPVRRFVTLVGSMDLSLGRRRAELGLYPILLKRRAVGNKKFAFHGLLELPEFCFLIHSGRQINFYLAGPAAIYSLNAFKKWVDYLMYHLLLPSDQSPRLVSSQDFGPYLVTLVVPIS